MKRGRPFEPGNKFGRGRPRGSKNQRTQLAQKLFEDNSAAIMALAINTSRQDRQMLRMLASRIAPRQRNVPVKIGSLPIDTLEDLDQASAAVLKKALSGRIDWGEAAEAAAVIETRRSVLESRNLERRVSVLESTGAGVRPIAAEPTDRLD
jgi:hypothetical protein